MKITSSISVLRDWINAEKAAGSQVGFVPTMGALHRGHLSLIQRSVLECDTTVVSIFVNPIQFDNNSDFESYPETLSIDLEKSDACGAGFVFIPDKETMYHAQKTYINVHDLTDQLCGKHRPGHFKGVFTVVAKLFNIVAPDTAYFGRKDLQQALSVSKMVLDLNFPIKIVIAPTIREDDGLALSSRNVHLSDDERTRALSIFRALKDAQETIMHGEKNLNKICDTILAEIEQKGRPDTIDYVTAVSVKALEPVTELTEDSAIAVAAWFGTTRLIDNMLINYDKGVSCEL
ncbi:MAG: pantoate--beta-alanine ligase [Spirochaetes bacterium]|jgi:pantoate--beta-alanine ligase|nr:pantoate--beta-alanine ligase [Spirochaetota bacterium]